MGVAGAAARRSDGLGAISLEKEHRKRTWKEENRNSFNMADTIEISERAVSWRQQDDHQDNEFIARRPAAWLQIGWRFRKLSEAFESAFDGAFGNFRKLSEAFEGAFGRAFEGAFGRVFGRAFERAFDGDFGNFRKL